jgi:hypothetical protein
MAAVQSHNNKKYVEAITGELDSSSQAGIAGIIKKQVRYPAAVLSSCWLILLSKGIMATRLTTSFSPDIT